MKKDRQDESQKGKLKIDKKMIDVFLEKLSGKIHLVILIKKKPAMEISLCNKTIIIDIKNPILALSLGLEEFIKKKEKLDMGFVDELKKLGYKIKIKYKMFKFDL